VILRSPGRASPAVACLTAGGLAHLMPHPRGTPAHDR